MSPIYRPDPTIGKDDGLHIQAITESLVRAASTAKDYDDTQNMMLLVPLQSLLRKHKMLCEDLERKIEAMLQKEMKANRSHIKRATTPTRRNSPFRGA